MKYLVTGGFGFIGFQLVSALARTGAEVVVLAPGHAPEGATPDRNVTVVKGRTKDLDALKRSMEGVSTCFHLAGVGLDHDPRHDELGQKSSVENYARAIFDCAHEMGNVPVIYASSAAVYDPQTKGAIPETAPLGPVNVHGLEKLDLEKQAAAAFLDQGVPSIGLRFFNVYGPTQSLRSIYCGAVRRFIDFIKSGTPVPLFGGGAQIRDWLHVEDAVESMLKIADQGFANQDVVNIGTGVGTSISDIAKKIEAASGISANYDIRPLASTDVPQSVADIRKAEELFGFRAKVTVDDGIKRMVKELM